MIAKLMLVHWLWLGLHTWRTWSNALNNLWIIII